MYAKFEKKLLEQILKLSIGNGENGRTVVCTGKRADRRTDTGRYIKTPPLKYGGV